MSVQDVSVRQERIEQLRRRIAAVPGKSESVARRMPGEADCVAAREVLPVPQPLARLLPGGGLTRGAVVTYSGSGALLLGLLAAVTGSGAHAVVVGLPASACLRQPRWARGWIGSPWLPDPGPDPVEVAAVLLDGLDLVILGLSGATVAPTRTRALVARARSKGCTVVVTGGRWNGAELTLEGEGRRLRRTRCGDRPGAQPEYRRAGDRPRWAGPLGSARPAPRRTRDGLDAGRRCAGNRAARTASTRAASTRAMKNTRVLAIWCTDWPAVAAAAAADLPATAPVAVTLANRVIACSATARAAGVRRGLRRREAQARCPGCTSSPPTRPAMPASSNR